MDEYVGLDVSMKETAISVRREGKRILALGRLKTRSVSPKITDGALDRGACAWPLISAYGEGARNIT